MKSIIQTLLLSLSLAVTSSAHAQKAGQHTLGFGLTALDTRFQAGPFSVSGGSFYQPFVSAGLTDVSMSSNSETMRSLHWMYMFTDHIATEMVVGESVAAVLNLNTPNMPSILGTRKTLPSALSAKLQAPNAYVKYVFNEPNDSFRPYVGLGVSYIKFDSVEPNLKLSEVNIVAGNGATLTSSWAPIYNLGFLYTVDRVQGLNFSISHIPFNTTATLTGASLGNGLTSTSEISIKTTVYSLSFTHRF